MDIAKYIIDHSMVLFDEEYGLPVKVDVKNERHTSMVYFCRVLFDTGLTKDIIIKKYDDNQKTRIISLKNEFKFSQDHYQDFNSDDIGIPRYLHFDVPNELLVIEYVDHSSTLEKTLFRTQKIYKSLSLQQLFFNIGKWLCCFHSLSMNSTPVILNESDLIKEIKPKWLQVFENQQEIQNDLNFLIDKTLCEKNPSYIAILHKEFGPGNILHVENKVYGIDFGTPETGQVLDDIAYFIISVLVLNKYPRHLLYRRIDINAIEIIRFLEGYLSTSIINEGFIRSYLFKFFLYKNLLRRMSHQFSKAQGLPKPANVFAKLLVENTFSDTRSSIFPNN